MGLTEGNVNTNNAQTHAHKSCVYVKVKNLKKAEENTEPNYINKHSEGDIEGNILPGMHAEHINEDLQKSITKLKNNTTLHALADVACSRKK